MTARSRTPGTGQHQLDGTPPPPSDYETWRDKVWPTFLDVARSGDEFLRWKVIRDHRLPAPPEPARDPARLIGELHRADIIRFAGYGDARDGSACKRWQGTKAAQQGRAA